MTEKPTDPIDPAEFVDLMAAVVGLPLQPEHRQGVIDNFARIMAIAPLVTDFPLTDQVEAAPIFEP